MLIEGFQGCEAKDHIYILFDAGNFELDEVRELYQLSAFLRSTQEKGVWEIMIGKDGQLIFPLEEKRYCVIRRENTPLVFPKSISRRLARFHNRGRVVPFTVDKVSSLGKWKGFWENRLDQMEKVWSEQLQHPPENDFERMFIEAFPYYMGMAENAIQYLVDTELDGEPVPSDSGTICHFRFSEQQLKRLTGWKNPFNWVLDHSARDLAEWTRSYYLRNIKTYRPEIHQFFTEYHTISSLSSFAWRLTYARLLFPLHFFESVEEYYITRSERRKNELLDSLQKTVSQSDEYERFLGEFFQVAGVPVRRLGIPEVEWLKRA